MRTHPARLRFLARIAAIATLLMPATAMADDPPPEVTVFKAGDDGYHTFRIPAVVVTKDGTLLAFCEGRKTGRGDHGDLDLVLKRSIDGGRTWGKLQLVYEEGGAAKVTIGNPAPVVDQSTGTIWLPFCRNNDEVLVTHSTDDGGAWAKPVEITADVKQPDWGWYATGPGNGIQLTVGKHAGRLVIPCDHRVDSKSKDYNLSGRSHAIYSDDHGKTWQLGEPTDWGMNECAVAELDDGKLLLNMRSYRGKAQRASATSADGGQTWSECRDEPALPEPICQGSLIRYSWPKEGDQESRSRLLFSNPASTKSRDHLTVRLSYDQGRAWPISRVVCAGSAAYSNLVALPDGTIGLLYERDDYSRIAFARLTLEWLSQGKEKVEK